LDAVVFDAVVFDAVVFDAVVFDAVVLDRDDQAVFKITVLGCAFATLLAQQNRRLR
jgi:hypothetical protein